LETRDTAGLEANGCQFKDCYFWISPADGFMKIISISFQAIFKIFCFEVFSGWPMAATGGPLWPLRERSGKK
jgi:hypothetical protein